MLIKFADGLIFVISGDILVSGFNIHSIIDLSTVVIKNILLIQFSGLRLNISLVVVIVVVVIIVNLFFVLLSVFFN